MRAEAERLSFVALRWMILGEWSAHPGRVIVSAVAIAIGVALGFAVHLINASALNEFSRAVRSVNGEADLQVRSATPLGFDEWLYPKLARLSGVADASPVVEFSAVIGGRTSATLLGLDPLRAASVTPSLIGRTAGADVAFDMETVFLSRAALAASGGRIGDAVAFAAGGREALFRIAGVLPGIGEDQRIAVIDISMAQWRFGGLGRLQRIDLRLAPGTDAARLRQRLEAVLPPAAKLVSAASEERRSDSLSRAYRVNLDMLAIVALITGAFLVYSAQSLSVTRRRPQFALLHVIGASRRAIVAQILCEGLAVGSIGAFAGLGLGVLLAAAALRLLGGDLGGGYFSGTRPTLIFAPAAAMVFFALGLAAALLGSFLPARETARAEPAIALKSVGDSLDPRVRPGTRLALALLAAGMGAAFLPPIGAIPLFAYLAIGLILAGGVAAMPWLARVLLAPLQRLERISPAIGLALKRLWGAPSQAAVALCGIVASTSLMIAMAVMVASFRGSVDDWLVQVLPDDIYLRVDDAASGGLAPEVQQRLAAVQGVARIRFLTMTTMLLSPERPSVTLIARPIDPRDPGRMIPLIGASLAAPAGLIPVWVSEPAAWLYGWRPGMRMALPIARSGGSVDVFVAGIWRDYARQYGAVVMEDGVYTRLTGDMLRTDASVLLAPGAEPTGVIARMRAALPSGIARRTAILEPRDLRKRALSIFDRSFAVTYLLEAIAILVGLAGVAATFSAQTLARTKEFGMLRHIGVRRGQIVAMLATEGGLLGAVGVIAGIGLGLGMSQILIQVVNPQSFHWTMTTRLPAGLLAGVAAAMIAASAGTALLAGRRALSGDAVRAVREDW